MADTYTLTYSRIPPASDPARHEMTFACEMATISTWRYSRIDVSDVLVELGRNRLDQRGMDALHALLGAVNTMVANSAISRRLEDVKLTMEV